MAGWPHVLTLALGALLATGCSSKDDPKPSMVADAASPDGAAADPNAVIGGFSIRLQPGTTAGDAPYSAVEGNVRTGAEPPLRQWKLVADEAGCKLSTPFVPFCSPGCGSDATCVADGVCTAKPQPRSAGTVSFKGLSSDSGPATVMLPPDPPSYYYVLGATPKLAFPPFAEGAALELEASGADVPAFKISNKGIAPLEVTSPSPIKVAENEPMQLRWKAPGAGSTTRIHIALDISHHGGTKGEIECDVADSGSLDIPATIITKLVKLGVAGYPTVEISRRAVGTAQLPAGRVEFVVSSPVTRDVIVPGFVSCNEQQPCPTGKMCQQDMLCK